MSHPAIDEHEVERLRREAAGEPEATTTDAPTATSGGAATAAKPPWSVARVKDAARKAAVPVVARLRQELVTASAGDQADVRAQVAELREELARTRSEHAAELAALHEELAATRAPSAPD